MGEQEGAFTEADSDGGAGGRFHRHRHLTQNGKRSTVATVALARELAGFLWAEMTDQPTREEAHRAFTRDR